MATVMFEDLEVGQLARVLADERYAGTLTDSFSKDFSRNDQINSASGSIMDNITEGPCADLEPRNLVRIRF